MLLFDEPTRNIVNLVRSGGAFDMSAVAATNNVRASLQGALSSLEGLQTPPGGGGSSGGGGGEGGEGGPTPPTIDLSGPIGQIEGIVGSGGPLVALASHMTDQITNLPQRLGMYMNRLNFSQGMGETPQFPSAGSEGSEDALASICSGVESFFGSIMGAAQEILSQIQAAIGQITSAISELVSAISGAVQEAIDTAISAINSVVAQITALAGQITNMIQQELNALASALTDLLGLSNALGLRGLFNHPCVRSVLGAVGTPSLLTNLNAP
jgi:predicted PurR-regulated permease PerM